MTSPTEGPRRLVNRPLRNAHWSLPTAIVAAWCVQIVAETCPQSPTGLARPLAVATVLVAAWCSHLRVPPSVGWRRFAKVMAGALGDLARLTAVTVVCFLPLALLLPAYSCMTPKAHAAEVLLSASSARTRITERAEQAGTVKGAGVGVTVDKERATAGAVVTDDGTIIVLGDAPPVVFVLQPTMQTGTVVWHCTGQPAALAPGACR